MDLSYLSCVLNKIVMITTKAKAFSIIEKYSLAFYRLKDSLSLSLGFDMLVDVAC